MGDNLPDQRIVVGRNDVVVINVGIDTNARPTRHVILIDPPRRRHKGIGVFRVNSALDGMAAIDHIALADAQLFSGGDANLFLNNVDAGNQFRHRMLDLNTGIHLDKIELIVLVQKLERPRATIADALAGIGAAYPDAISQALFDTRRRRFFNDFLVTALHRAIAIPQIDGVFELIRQDLNLDVTRVLQKFFHVHHWIAERRLGFGAGQLHRIDQRSFRMHHAHATPTTAARGFDDYGITHLSGDALQLLRIVRQSPLGTRHHRHAGLFHRIFGADFVAHQADRIGARTDKHKTGILHPFGEIGVLRQKAVAGMNRLGVGHFRRADDRRNVEITRTRWRRSDADGFIGQHHVFGVGVGFGMNRNGFDAELAAGALDSQCDFAAIGN